MELEMKEYLKIIRKRLWIILSVIIVATCLTGVYSYMYIQPVYEANVKLIVTRAQELQGAQAIDTGSIDANIKLINTYKEVIKTTAIMEKVVSQYPNLKLDANQLIGMVNVSSTSDSQLMTISVQDISYVRASQIVNAISEVFRNQIPLLMKIDNVSILDAANEKIVPPPVQPNPKMNIVISLIVSLMLAIGIVFILEYLDDSVKTEEDIKNYFGLSTLGVISKIKNKELQANALAQSQRQVGEPGYVSAKS